MDENLAKLEALAHARREDVATVRRRFGGRVPAVSRHVRTLSRTVLREAGVRDGLAYVVMPNGRTFYGYLSKPNHRRAYPYVKDVIPACLDEDTFLLGLDIAHRYASDYSWPPAEVLPPRDGTIVECGAYLGHKTVRFADELLAGGGRVLAIEMMPDNAEILRRNIRENGLDHKITVIEAGVWSGPGTLAVKGKGRQRNSLITLATIEQETGHVARVDSLDNLLAEWGEDCADLVYMTINGAEIEALEAIVSGERSRVRSLFVAAPYSRDGRPNAEVASDILRRKGFSVHRSDVATRVIAVNARRWGARAGSSSSSRGSASDLAA